MADLFKKGLTPDAVVAELIALKAKQNLQGNLKDLFPEEFSRWQQLCVEHYGLLPLEITAVDFVNQTFMILVREMCCVNGKLKTTHKYLKKLVYIL